MKRAHFMAQLRDGLAGLHHTDIGDIVSVHLRLVLKFRSHHRLGKTDRPHDRGFPSAEFNVPHAAVLAAFIPMFFR